MEDEKVAYIISSIDIDYQPPYLYNDIGVIEKNNAYPFILKNLIDFVYDKIDLQNLKTVEDIEQFWLDYESEIKINNRSWSACIFLDSKWCNIYPNNKELLIELCKKRDEYKKKLNLL